MTIRQGNLTFILTASKVSRMVQGYSSQSRAIPSTTTVYILILRQRPTDTPKIDQPGMSVVHDFNRRTAINPLPLQTNLVQELSPMNFTNTYRTQQSPQLQSSSRDHRKQTNRALLHSSSHRNYKIWHRHKSLRQFFGAGSASSSPSKEPTLTHKKGVVFKSKENVSYKGKTLNQQPRKQILEQLKHEYKVVFNKMRNAPNFDASTAKRRTPCHINHHQKINQQNSSISGGRAKIYDPQAYNWRRSSSQDKRSDMNKSHQLAEKEPSTDYYSQPQTNMTVDSRRVVPSHRTQKVKQILSPSRQLQSKMQQSLLGSPERAGVTPVTKSLLFTFGSYGA